MQIYKILAVPAIAAALCAFSLKPAARLPRTANTGTRYDTRAIPKTIPLITFPGISQAQFKDAFDVLDECVVWDEPRYGFTYPFIAPGGKYGGCWWQLDASIGLTGVKWLNQGFSENMLRGFAAVQKPDGRIPLYGHDKVPGYPECSSLPKLFTGAYQVLKQSEDKGLTLSTYNCLQKYLEWWYTDTRYDSGTGLITGVFEESFPPVENRLKTIAQVDLNVEIVKACNIMAALAKQLGKQADYKRYTRLEINLKKNINKYMWNEDTGAYYAYNVKENKLDTTLVCYTFDAFRLNIAPKTRMARMIQMLTDDKYFNWNGNAITSIAKTDKSYTEVSGTYNGAPAWSGDVWTLRNEAVVEGLKDAGQYDLAAYLALKTVKMFNGNYTEFIKTSDGTGHGEKRYAWTAAQYIKILTEDIFGIDYNVYTQQITIKPNVDAELTGKPLALENLVLPNGNKLSVFVTRQKQGMDIRYSITGNNKDMSVIVAYATNQPNPYTVTGRQAKKVSFSKLKQQAAYMYRVNNGKAYAGDLSFISKKH